jgi:hypothetical protein
MSHSYAIQEWGLMLNGMPAGSFDLHIAWIGNSFRAAVKTAEQREWVFFRTYTFADNTRFEDVLQELKAIVSTDVLFANVYKKVKVGLLERAQLYPVDFFVEDKSETISEQLEDSSLIVAQPIQHKQLEFYNAFFPNASLCVLSASWLNSILQQSSDTKLFVQIDYHLMYVAYALDKNSPQFFNSFEFKTTEDFGYFINLVAKELSLDRSKIELVFSGDLVRASKLYDMAFTYFQSVSFLTIEELSFSSLFSQYPRHQNIHLFTL